jgi:hypothetical protein
MRKARQRTEDIARGIEFAALTLSAIALVPGIGPIALGLALVAGVASAAYQCANFNRARCAVASGFALLGIFNVVGKSVKLLTESQAKVVEWSSFSLQSVEFVTYRRSSYGG